MQARKEDPIDWKLKNYLQTRYSTIPKDDVEKALDNILELAELSRSKNKNLRSLLETAARMMFRLFDFGEIAVGLRDPKDGLYRYEVIFGYSKNAETEFRKLAYTHEDMVSYNDFPFVKIGRISELDPAEGFPDKEKHLCDRPLAVGESRGSPEEFVEGDYMDFWMYDSAGDLIGWFELAKPRDGKMPSCETVRWIEVFTEFCAMMVERKMKSEKPLRQ